MIEIGGPHADRAAAARATWERSHMVGDGFAGRLAEPAIAARLASAAPASKIILHLHGCTHGFAGYPGNADSDLDIAQRYAGAGFLVVVPDSFARPRRGSNCAGRYPAFDIDRRDAIVEALRQPATARWAVGARFALSGHSEGGFAVARWQGNEFRAAIVSGWGCSDSAILLPATVPVLNVKSRADPVDTRPGDCRPQLAARAGSGVIDTGATEHW